MSEMILYTTEDGLTKINVQLEDETVWLTQDQIATLFGKAKSTISEHIKHIFEEGELVEKSVVRKFRTTAGLTNFKGEQPTQAEAMVAKNFLEEKELRVLNNLVAAYFDLAECNAIEEREMRMADYVRELDNILKSTGRKVLDTAGNISHAQAELKAKQEYQKCKAKTLSAVEKDYLKSISLLEQKAQKGSRKKGGKT